MTEPDQVDTTSTPNEATPDEAQAESTTHTMTPEALEALRTISETSVLEAQSHEHDSEPFDLLVHLDNEHPSLLSSGLGLDDAITRHSEVHDVHEHDLEDHDLERETDQSVTYEPLGETTEGSTSVDSPTEAEVDALPADSEAVVPVNVDWVQDKQEQEQERSFIARPPFILSFVDSDHPHGGFVIGWDTCGACNLHIRTCRCSNGPEQPDYVKRWRPAADTEHDKPNKATVTADSRVVEKAVDEAVGGPTEGWTADGRKVRKKRADAGVPRGPRKKVPATPESVTEAADDLSAAMSKE